MIYGGMRDSRGQAKPGRDLERGNGEPSGQMSSNFAKKIKFQNGVPYKLNMKRMHDIPLNIQCIRTQKVNMRPCRWRIDIKDAFRSHHFIIILHLSSFFPLSLLWITSFSCQPSAHIKKWSYKNKGPFSGSKKTRSVRKREWNFWTTSKEMNWVVKTKMCRVEFLKFKDLRVKLAV